MPIPRLSLLRRGRAAQRWVPMTVSGRRLAARTSCASCIGVHCSRPLAPPIVPTTRRRRRRTRGAARCPPVRGCVWWLGARAHMHTHASMLMPRLHPHPKPRTRLRPHPVRRQHPRRLAGCAVWCVRIEPAAPRIEWGVSYRYRRPRATFHAAQPEQAHTLRAISGVSFTHQRRRRATAPAAAPRQSPRTPAAARTSQHMRA